MRQSIYFLIILFAFTACKKDDDNNSSGNNNPSSPEVSYENPQLSGINSTADFFGRITSQNGDNIEGALVEVGNKSTTTNVFGFYEIDNALVDQDYAVIEVTAPNYFKQFRSFNPKETVLNMQDIQMIPQVFTGAFQSATGGTIQLPGGGQVIFQAGDLVRPDGSAYSGQVVVASAYLDPTDPTLSSYMPGSLLAVDSDDELAVMITYGMAGVELYGSNGQLLQLGDNMTASFEMPIQSEQMAFAPESIPLWFFDETNGIWREDGVATKTGDKYVGSVSHFTFWNCDVPADYAIVEGTLVYGNTNYNTVGAFVKLVRTNGDWGSSIAYPDGSFGGYVPANESLEASIYVFQCGASFDYGTIPPIAIDETYDMGEIDLSALPGFETATFSATIVDCNGDPLSGLVVDFEYNGYQFYALSNSEGFIEFMLPCINGNELSYTIIDMNEALESLPGELQFTPVGGNNYELGELPYCETQTIGEFFTYSEGVNTVAMFDLDPLLLLQEVNDLYLNAQGPTIDGESDEMCIFIIQSPFGSGTGQGAFITDAPLDPGVDYQLENGNYYKAIFDIDQSEVYINGAEFFDVNNLERVDVTITGFVNVSIYEKEGGDPINEYTSTATSHYYYWPE